MDRVWKKTRGEEPEERKKTDKRRGEWRKGEKERRKEKLEEKREGKG